MKEQQEGRKVKRSRFMQMALEEANAAGCAGEVPVGAVILHPSGKIIAQTQNSMRRFQDPTAHAEMLAIREACAFLRKEKLIGCHIWVTLEPCAMCAGAIAAARLDRLYFAASDPKSGGVLHGAQVFRHSHHKPEVYSGIAESAASAQLQEFFLKLRSDRTRS